MKPRHLLPALALAALALASSSCGNSATPPAPKPDSGTVDRCESELCHPGEDCDPQVGCFCTADSCPSPAICSEDTGRCLNLCANADCQAGEACVPETGKCECGSGSSDPCPSDRYCDPGTKRCGTKCTGAGCNRGERCDPATGACQCGDCAAEQLGCDPTSNRCVDRCPSCPVGELCDDKVVGECHCTETSCAASQVCDSNRRCVDLCAGKACSPGERCDAKTGACVCDACASPYKCDPVSNRCVPMCQGVTCVAGEACQETTGQCRCGINPNTCPTGRKCDTAAYKCVDMCQGIGCPAGEACNSTSGDCECAWSPDDTCTAVDPTTRCDATSKECVARCLGVSCAPGESCNSSRGACECAAGTSDSCSAAAATMRCDPASLRCQEKCKAVTCATGEACVATSGECHCGIPNTCPSGQKCDSSTLKCVGLCSGVSCAVRGESCEAATGVCACATSPADTCTPADASTKCDPATRKCVSQCAGVGCAPGESCNVASGACECAAAPSDTCTASVSSNRCNAATLHCEPKCAGVTCATGEGCVPTTGACACGVSPNTCPSGKKCDAATLHCVGLCTGVTCTVPGELCDGATGACACTTSPDACSAADATTRCEPASLKCVPKCQGVYCAAGESCVATSGACACSTAPDSCSAADATERCSAASHRCEAKCTGVTCAAGMACVTTSGECHCGLPNTCPTGQKCESAGLTCVPACQGVTCSTPGESCVSTTGLCACETSPADTCTAASASTKCDAATSRCVSKCAGISCAPGEACDSGTATCKCTASPDSCTASDATQKCDGASLRCVARCSGVSCSAGETCNPANGACECAAESCLANYACSATTKHCEPCAQETDAAFCARQSKECDTLTGTDNCGRARIANCGACTSPAACSGGLCLKPGGPTNDNCIGASALTFDGSGKAHVTGDTTNATDSGHAAVCGVGFGNDVVYSFTTTAVKNVDLSLSFAAGTQYPVLYVRKACTSPSTSDELACADALPGMTALTAINNLAPGTYYVFADAFSSDFGTFTLDVQLSDPPPVPANDKCAAPTVLTLTSGAASATGDTRSAVDDYTGTCATANGGDAVFAVDLSVARSLTATVTRDGTTPAFQPAVYLRKVCTSALSTDEAACGSDWGGGAASAAAASVGPGRIYVVVDGLAGTAGRYALQITTGSPVTAPTNEKCASAASLTLSAGGTASVASSTSYAANDGSGACAGTGPELAWTFTTTSIATITAKVTPSSGSPTFQPVVYLRAVACEGTGMTEPACSAAYGAGQVATASAVNAAAGTYWVFVDGYAGTKGDFTLDVTLVPPNDLCSGAQAMAANTTYAGNTYYAATNYGPYAKTDFSTVCQVTSNLGTKGPDVLYAYTPTATGNFTVTLTPTNGSYDPSIWVVDAPCGDWPDYCMGFADVGMIGEPETVTIAGTAGITYFFVVGSYFATGSGAAGPFTISVQ